MSCRRTHDLDLLDFLAEPARADFDAFRDHYPRCADCTAEVRAWTELHEALRAEGADAHPDPELLARFDADRRGLAESERLGLEQHLEGCAPCRDELRALRAFAPAALAATSPARDEPPVADATRRPLPGPLAALGRLLWNPVLAYALVALLLLPNLDTLLPGDRLASEAPPPVATPQEPEAEAPAPQEPAAMAPPVAGPTSPAPERDESVRARGELREIAPAPGRAPRAAGKSESASGRSYADDAMASPPEPRAQLRQLRREFALGADSSLDAGVATGSANVPARSGALAKATEESEVERSFRSAATEAGAFQVGAGADALRERTDAETLEETPPAETASPLREVTPAEARDGFTLRIALDEPADPVAIRIVAVEGERELRDRLPIVDGLVVLHVPGGWLQPGAYRVRVGAGEGAERMRLHWAGPGACADEGC